MQRKNKLLTGNYEKEKTGLIRKIARLKDKQRAKYNQVKKLNSRYHNKKIHLGKFETKLKKLLEGYTLTSWFDDNAIRTRKLENELFVVNSKIKTSQNNNVYREITFVSLLILFTFAYFYLDPSIVGYGVLDSQYFINNTGFITLNKNVTSLRLSGYLEGNGTAKIYLEDYLVLDSTFLNQTVSQTGKNIVNNQSDSTNLFGIQPVNEILSTRIDFADICIETCNNISPSHLLKVEIEGSLIIQITRFDYNLERKILPEEETAEPVFGIPLENFTSNETVSSKRNITVENLTFENLTVTYRDESIQEKAEINKPVEWKLKTKNKSISLPSEAVNVEVYKEVFSLTSNSTKEKAKLKNVFGINSVSDKKLIEVDELNETQLEVTYFTKAPYSIESNFSEINNKIIKNITIKSDSEIHYSNVLSYTDISPEIQNINQVKLFHYVIKNISIGNETNGSDYETVKEEITNNKEYNLTFEDTNSNGLIDKLYWNTLELSEQNFSVEISLNILTVQSYPTVHGNWTVLFNTTGTANLSIKAVNGTTWSNDLNNTVTDLTFLELKCGNITIAEGGIGTVGSNWINDSVFISNYTCNETASEISKVLTTGKHTLEFTFGDIKKYAYNTASGLLNLTLNSPLNATVKVNNSVTLNITAETNASLLKELIIYGGNTSNLDYNNILYRNVSPINLQINNITYNFSALPIKPTGTDSLVLLMHFDNITNFENATNGSNFTIYDWSLNNNNGTGATNSSNGGPQFNVTGGKFGGAFEFDGKDDYLDISHSSSLQPSQLSACLWIKPIKVPGISLIKFNSAPPDGSGNYFISTIGSQWSLATDGGVGRVTGGTVNLNQWNYLCLAYTSSNLVGYVDGVSIGSDSTPGTFAGAFPLWIGTYNNNFTNGTIDEVAIWNRSLSAKEIQDLYNLNNRRYYWKANATDLAGNVNNTAIQEFNITLPPANANTTLRPTSPYRTSSLNCSFTFTDPNPDDSGVGTFIFYNNTFEHYRTNVTISSPGNNTVVSYQLTNNATNIFTAGENWTCAARTNDLMINSLSWVNASVAINETLNVTLLQLANITSVINNSASLNISVRVGEKNVTELIIYAGNTTNLDYNNIIYRNTSIQNFSNVNITYNFSALPVKPDGTDGLVLLYHFDNASSLENDTHTLDYSNQVKALNNGTYIRWNTSQNSLSNISGRFGNSFMFNGMNNFVNVNDTPSLRVVQNITLSAWIKFDYQFTNYSSTYSNISSQGVIDKGDYGLYFDEHTGTLNFKLDNASAVTNWTMSRDGNINGNGNETLSLKEYNGFLYAGKGGFNIVTPEGDIFWCNPAFNTTGDITVCDPNEWFISFDGVQEVILSLEVFNGRLYAGQGLDTGDGDVLVCFANNTGNVSICDGNSDWVTSFNGAQERIQSLEVFNGRLYAGQAIDAGDGDVLVCNPNITGNDKECDSGDWVTSFNGAQERIQSLEVFNGRLYAGQAIDAGDGDVLVCNPEKNTTNLGEGLKECDPDEWTISFNGAQERIQSLEVFNGNLYAGQGSGAGDGDVLVCNPEFNTSAFSDSTICDPDEWTISFNGAQENIFSLGVFNGKLYAGQGSGAGDGDVFVCDPSRNTTGNPSFNSTPHTLICDPDEWTISFNGAQETIYALNTFNNKLYQGSGTSTGNISDDILVFGYNNTDVINSTTRSWNANQWYHLTGVYNGSYMLLYVNGILENSKAVPMLIEQNITNLFVGYDSAYGYFNGTIDEVAIYNRTLSAKEIKNLYNLNNRRYYWKANATDLAGNINNTAIQEFNITLPPDNANTLITPGTPTRSTDNLNCSFTFIDPNPDDAGVGTIIWYNLSREHFRTNITISAPGSSTVVSYQLTYNNTNNFTSGENWTCAARTNDGVINSGLWVNYSILVSDTNLSYNATPFIIPNPLFTANNFNATSVVADPEGDLMTVEIVFWNGTREHFRRNITSLSNNSLASYTLTNNATNIFTKGENWTAAFKVFDGNRSSSWVNASLLISEVSQVSPSNNTFLNTKFLNLTYNLTVEGGTPSNCTLYLDGPLNLNQTDTTISEDINQTFNLTFQDKTFTWFASCTSSNNTVGNTSIKVFTVDTTVPNLTLNSPLNATTTTNISVTLNITTADTLSNITKLIIYAGNSTNLNYNNLLYINLSIQNSTQNITYNFTALPIKPDGTGGLVLLHHYDNASSLENDTHTLDYSNQVKALNNGTYIRWNATQQSLGNSAYGKFGNSFLFNGINNFVNVNNSASLQIVQNITLSAWIKFDYQFTNYSSTYSNISSQGVIDKGDYGLYFDEHTGTLNFKLDNASAVTNWTESKVGNRNYTLSLKSYNGILYAGKGNSGGEGDIFWCNPGFNTTGDLTICDPNEWFLSYDGTQEEIEYLEVYNGKLYAGQGLDTGDGDVLVCFANNTGNVSVCDGNSDWVLSYDGAQETIYSLGTFNGYLYAGQGYNAFGDGDVYICRPNTTGDDKLCDTGDWIISFDGTQGSVVYLEYFNNKLYAGEGGSPGSGDVRVCNPETNTTNLGEGLKQCDPNEWTLSYDGSTNFVNSIKNFNNRLYITEQGSTGEGDVRVCNPETNTTSDITVCDSNEWILSRDGAQESSKYLEVYNGKLFSGQGSDVGDGDIFVCDPSRNTTGDITVCDSNEWTVSYDGSERNILIMEVFNGRLYSSQGTAKGNVTDDILVFGYNNTDVINSTTTTWNANRWYHIAGVYNGASMLLYVNGILENQKAVPMLIEQNITNLLIGYDSGSAFFNGTIDEVAIWNRSLSSKEIADLYTLNNRRYYWKANATDLAGNINNTAIQEFNITLPPANANTTLRPTSPYRTSSLNCSFTFTDPNPDDAGVGTIIWYNNTFEHFRTNISISSPGNNTVVSYQLANNATNIFTAGENWTCAARTNDLMINSLSWVNASVAINETLNVTLLQLANITSVINNSASLNISVRVGEKNVTELIIYAGNTTNLDYNNIIYRNTSIQNFSNVNITYNFTALPVKPDGTDGLVLLYHFDNITNFENATNGSNFTVYDWSLNGNNASNKNNASSGGPQFNVTGGKFGSAFKFSGDDRLLIADNPSLEPSRITIATWIKSTQTTQFAGWIDKRVGSSSGYSLGFPSTNGSVSLIIEVFGASPEIFSTKSVNDGLWHHIVGTYDQVNLKIYVDGIERGSSSETRAIVYGAENLFIGGDAVSTHLFNGSIDEVAIWNRSLSAKEIADMYTLNSRRYYWKANATDLAGNINNTAIQEFNITLPPANANTTLRPALPFYNSSLNCSFTFIDPNPDDAGVGTIIFYNQSREHFRTNISISAPGNNTIVSYTLTANLTNNFTSTNNWTCAARTNDLMINSEAWVNASVVINNTKPHNPVPFIFPATPFHNSSLNASSIIIDQDANDARSVEIIFYNNSREHVRVNFTNVANGTNQSYQLTYNTTNNFTSGENWTSAFRIYDGINLSEWVNASVVINNTKPHNPVPFIFSQPFLSDSTIRTNSSLNASSIIIDQDANDARSVEIQFYNGSRLHFRSNLTNVANGTNQSYTLTENQTNKFSKGENWTAAFRIYDGINLSDWVNASKLISNTNPRNPNTTIRPDVLFGTDNLNCSFTYIDTDNDAATATFIFYNNSVQHFSQVNISIANNSNNSVVSYVLFDNTTANLTRNQNWTCAIKVNDGNIDSDYVNASKIIQNTAPSFDLVINNSTWNEDTSLLNVTDLKGHFTDKDNDTLTFTALNTNAITVLIDSFNNISYIPSSNWFGTENLTIRASDGANTTDSNIITLTVSNVVESGKSVETVSGRTRVLVGLDIIGPSPVSLIIGDKAIFPIIVRNDKGGLLTNVVLSAKSSSDQLGSAFINGIIPVLSSGQQQIVNLELRASRDILENRYSVILTGTSNEGATDSAEFFVNIAEFGSANKSIIIPRLQAAKELFNNNPVCLELNELLNQAEAAVEAHQFTKAESLIDSIINGCNDLISFKPEKIEKPIKKANQNLILITEFSALMFLSAAFVYYRRYRRRLSTN